MGAIIITDQLVNDRAQRPFTPGETVARALARFKKRLRGTDALLVPWVQDFSFTTPYDLEKVRAQIEAGRRVGSKGFLLWNPEGVYTDGALSAP